MNRPLNILIVEDEPLVIYAIEKALDSIANTIGLSEINITIVNNYESAHSKIDVTIPSQIFNLAILNIDITSKEANQLLFADDLAPKLKEQNSEISLMALTTNSDSYRIYNLMQTINPESLLLKRDIDFNQLVKAFQNILSNTPFYSKTVLRLMRSHMANTISIDKTDRSILYYLSQGLKTKELTDLVFLSIGAIERRKRQLKDLFNVKERGDRLLIAYAKEHGYI